MTQIYVCICVCVCVHTCIWIHRLYIACMLIRNMRKNALQYMYSYLYIHKMHSYTFIAYMCICIHRCIYVNVYICICVYKYICIYVYMYICIYVYMYICIYVYMYICTDTRRRRCQWTGNAFFSTYQRAPVTKRMHSLQRIRTQRESVLFYIPNTHFLEGVGGSSHRGNAFSSTYQKYSRWRKEGVGVSSHRVNVFYST